MQLVIRKDTRVKQTTLEVKSEKDQSIKEKERVSLHLIFVFDNLQE